MQVALTFSESAAFLGVTRTTLERWVSRGLIFPPHQPNARGHRTYAQSDLVEWMASYPKQAARTNAQMLANAEQRTKTQREVAKVQRKKETARAAREAQKQVVAETADADLEPAAPVDPVLALAHAPRRQGRHQRRLMVPPDAGGMTNADIDCRLGIGAMPKLRWHL